MSQRLTHQNRPNLFQAYPNASGAYHERDGDGVETMELCSNTRPTDVQQYLLARPPQSYVRFISAPPRVYTTASGTDFWGRQEAQRHILAHLIAPVERMRGTLAGIAYLKMETDPGRSELTTQRLLSALEPLCRAEAERKVDQSRYMTAWEGNQAVLEKFIKSYSYMLVRVVLSWLPAQYDHASESDAAAFRSQALFASHFIDGERRLLAEIHHDLSSKKAWMVDSGWHADISGTEVLALLAQFASAAQLLRQQPSLPPLPPPPSRPNPAVIPAVPAPAAAGSAIEHGLHGAAVMAPASETTAALPSSSRLDDALDNIIEQIQNVAPRPAAASPYPLPISLAPASPGKLDPQQTTTVLTATLPELSPRQLQPTLDLQWAGRKVRTDEDSPRPVWKINALEFPPVPVPVPVPVPATPDMTTPMQEKK
ncbi:MAG: hypothetical protein ACRYGK_09090, partial [Janthinobacterium lividum]